eukprot:g22497.t1
MSASWMKEFEAASVLMANLTELEHRRSVSLSSSGMCMVSRTGQGDFLGQIGAMEDVEASGCVQGSAVNEAVQVNKLQAEAIESLTKADQQDFIIRGKDWSALAAECDALLESCKRPALETGGEGVPVLSCPTTPSDAQTTCQELSTRRRIRCHPPRKSTLTSEIKIGDRFHERSSCLLILKYILRSKIISKGISAGHSKNAYRGLVAFRGNATQGRNFSQCDSLLIGNKGEAHGGRRARVFRCRHGGQPRKASTFPYIEAADGNNQVEHEATTSRVSEEQLLYLTSRGLAPEEAVSLVINGFCQDFWNEL